MCLDGYTDLTLFSMAITTFILFLSGYRKPHPYLSRYTMPKRLYFHPLMPQMIYRPPPMPQWLYKPPLCASVAISTSPCALVGITNFILCLSGYTENSHPCLCGYTDPIHALVAIQTITSTSVDIPTPTAPVFQWPYQLPPALKAWVYQPPPWSSVLTGIATEAQGGGSCNH